MWVTRVINIRNQLELVLQFAIWWIHSNLVHTTIPQIRSVPRLFSSYNSHDSPFWNQLHQCLFVESIETAVKHTNNRIFTFSAASRTIIDRSGIKSHFTANAASEIQVLVSKIDLELSRRRELCKDTWHVVRQPSPRLRSSTWPDKKTKLWIISCMSLPGTLFWIK